MKELKIGNLLAKVPIVQGGLGVGISLSGLASAVANAGSIVWRCDKIMKVSELFAELKAEYEVKAASI